VSVRFDSKAGRAVERLPAGLVAAVFVLFLGLVVFWAARTSPIVLREQLKVLQFWSLEACVAVLALCVWLVSRESRRTLDGTDGRRLLVIGAAAVLLTVFVAPRTSRIYYDEQIYQGVGQNLADLHRAQMCNDGNVEYGRLQCANGEYNKQPYAYPHLLSLAYRLFGVHPITAFVVNNVVMVVAVCAVYLLSLWLFADAFAALISALLLVLMPQQVLWSATAAAEPSAALACTVAVLAAIWFRRSRSTAALAFAAVATVYSAQFRPESMLIVPVVAVVLWECRDELRRSRTWWVALLALALIAVHVGHSFAVRNEGWGTTDARLSLRYLLLNLPANGGFYLGDRRFPIAITALAAGGLAARGFTRERLALGLWFGLFFVMFLSFYAGSYNYGADVRYSLMTYPPLAVLAGLGASRMRQWLAGRIVSGDAGRVVIAGLLAQTILYLPEMRATTEEAWAARADVRFAEAMAPQLRGNKYVLTHNPGMFHVWGINAGQMSRLVGDPGYALALNARYSQGVYLHWNFWCNVQDAVQQEFCQRALESQPADPVGEYREREQRFVLYRLRPEWPITTRKSP
jgi:4-amino-4-deoxy-L-arabinose transferase-like glycosyltransferase